MEVETKEEYESIEICHHSWIRLDWLATTRNQFSTHLVDPCAARTASFGRSTGAPGPPGRYLFHSEVNLRVDGCRWPAVWPARNHLKRWS